MMMLSLLLLPLPPCFSARRQRYFMLRCAAYADIDTLAATLLRDARC